MKENSNWTKEDFIRAAQRHPHLTELSKAEIRRKAEAFLEPYDWSDCPNLEYEVTRAVEEGVFE